MSQLGFFDETDHLTQLSKMGDPLERLNAVIDWSIFKEPLRRTFEKERKGTGGRPPFDCTFMFKVLVLQRLYNLSDAQTEYQIRDRLSFMRFLGLNISSKIPDEKTIWAYKDALVKAGVVYELFDAFGAQLQAEGIITRAGSIVDATFVDAPRQRNTPDENEAIKRGETPDVWKSNAHKLRQKDVDARWAKKGDETHYGYKNHTKADQESKIITDWTTTPASTHDSQELEPLVVDEQDTVLYADSAYIGQSIPESIKPQICERGSRWHALTDEQKKTNREKSKIRCRIEHIFGFITNSMHGVTFRGIGIDRAHFWNGLTNLAYNLRRYETIRRLRLSRQQQSA